MKNKLELLSMNIISPKLFEELYTKLNSAQKRAVDAVEGPVMVVAGPGTGKTQILTLRIANILKLTDTNPGNILALTFTESSAANMRRRLSEIIGSSAYEVRISTFHGFCNDIIKNYPEEFPRIIGAENLSEIDQVKIIESLIESLPLKELKPFGDPFYYLRAIMANLNQLKREGVPVEKFGKIVGDEQKNFESLDDLYYASGPHKGKMKGDYQKRQKSIAKNKELAEIYVAYEDALRSSHRYDYSDMIMEVLRALEVNKNLLLMLQEAHQYILVDEHQDTNNAQNKIIELLGNFHPNPNIFVVGDEKQAIFRFQGASLENFLYFKTLYPSAELIVLEENYRSTQSILDSAHSLFSASKRLKANQAHKDRKIFISAFENLDEELFSVARSIEEKLKNKTPAGEVAILYRDNRDAFPIARALEKVGLPFVIESDEDVLGDPDIRKLIAIFRAVASFGYDELLVSVLHIDFLKIDQFEIYKIIDSGRHERGSIYEALRHSDFPAARELYGRLASWAGFAKNRGLEEVFEVIVRESGLLARALSAPDALSELAKINGLFDEARKVIAKNRNAGLGDFLEHLDAISAHKLLIKKSGVSHRRDGIRLMTTHKSKGQEFDFVYIINALDGHWGGRRRAEQIKLPDKVYSLRESGKLSVELMGSGADVGNDDEGDERRLFYVALTRARRGVSISYAKFGLDGREQLPSQFIGEVKLELVDAMSELKFAADLQSDPAISFAPAKVVAVDLRAKEIIKELFDHNGFSVTALNNYLNCPWKYFYTNLLRIPRAKVKHQMYGTAIHAALKDFFDSIRHCEEKSAMTKQSLYNKDFLLARFEYHLKNEPLREADYADCLLKGQKTLSGYFDAYRTSWVNKVINELNITGILLVPEIRLTGKIDKLELYPSSEAEKHNAVNVVDYKTGHAKSRGEIEGATKNSNGDIKRQLVFYNLLLNRFDAGKYKMVSGDIDFVEPDEKGRYHKERFVVAPEEVAALEEQIKKVVDEIFSVSFWDNRCEEKDCEFCALREMMR